MPTPPAEIITLISVFATAFTVPTFRNALVLLYGAILAPGRRTVAAALRAMGLADAQHFTNYHRVLNRAEWSPWVLSQLLLNLILLLLLAPDAPIQLVIDETLERRRGPQIKYKGRFYDAVRSTPRHPVTTLGIRWICLSILVALPWSRRPWALPFMVMPALAPGTSAKLGKRHHTTVEWAAIMIARVRRWQPDREITVVGDSTYAATDLVYACQTLKRAVKLVSRLRLDAVLHDTPSPQPKSKRGPKPKKGARQPSLAERLSDPQTVWQACSLPWYGGDEKRLEFAQGTALWYHRGHLPVPIRWVLVRCPESSFKPTAFFCSDATVTAMPIITWFIARWTIEVTFQEMRAHLGFGAQREWSERAIERTTPCLFGLFSLVALMAAVLYPDRLPIRSTAWYAKEGATFIDALAAVRRALWSNGNYSTSTSDPDTFSIPKMTMFSLLETACYSL